MEPQIQWVHGYITADKVYCVYNAPNREMVRQNTIRPKGNTATALKPSFCPPQIP